MIGQHSDANFQVIRSLGLQFLDGQVPQFVKQADIDRDIPAKTAPLSVFADPARRQFPVHTKSATYISALYIAGGLANGQAWDGGIPLQVAQSRIEKAASAHGILNDVLALRATIQEKSASNERTLTDDDFALVVDYNGSKIRRFPTVTAAAIEKSAAKLEADREVFPYAWRQLAAINLLKSAARKNVNLAPELADHLAQTAGMYPKPVEKIATALRERASLFANAEDKERMVKLAHLALKEGTDLHTMCGLLDDLDQHTKVAELYSRGVPTPEAIFFEGVGTKSASAEEVIELITGNAYTPAQLKSAGVLPFSVLGDLTSELIEGEQLNMAKAADILPTLPRDSALLLDKALEAAGVFPRGEEKSAEFEQLMRFTVSVDGKLEPAGYRMSYKAAAGTPIPVVPPVGATPTFSVNRPKMSKPKPAQLPTDEKTDSPPAVAAPAH